MHSPHTHTYTHILSHVHVLTYMCKHAHIHKAHTQVHTCIHIHLHTGTHNMQVWVGDVKRRRSVRTREDTEGNREYDQDMIYMCEVS